MNDFKNIDIPRNIDNITIDSINRAEHDNLKKKKSHINYAIALSLSILIFGVSFNNITSALETFKNSISTFFHDNINESIVNSYTTPIGQSIEKSNIKITIKDVLLDDNQIYIAVNVNKSNVNFEDISLKLGNSPKEYNCISGNYKYNDDSSQDILYTFNIDNLNLDEDLDINLTFNNAAIKNINSDLLKNDLKFNAKWNFKFKINNRNLKNNIEIIEVNKNNVVEDTLGFNIEEVKIYPFKIKIKFTSALLTCPSSSLVLKTPSGNVFHPSDSTYNYNDNIGYYNFILDTTNLNEISLIKVDLESNNQILNDCYLKLRLD